MWDCTIVSTNCKKKIPHQIQETRKTIFLFLEISCRIKLVIVVKCWLTAMFAYFQDAISGSYYCRISNTIFKSWSPIQSNKYRAIVPCPNINVSKCKYILNLIPLLLLYYWNKRYHRPYFTFILTLRCR